MLTLKGTIVTADALNCQREIARQIVDQGGDYALALKGNQGTLHDDVRRFLDDPRSGTTTAAPVVDGDHGRIETRTATVATDIGWLQEHHKWPGLAAVGKVVRVRETTDKTTTETAYYLLSTALSAERLNQVVRAHWGVENQLHWRLDVVMNEDHDRTRLDNAPHNLAVLRHMALNVMQKDITKGSLRTKSCAPDGMITISLGSSLCSEVRLPCLSPFPRTTTNDSIVSFACSGRASGNQEKPHVSSRSFVYTPATGGHAPGDIRDAFLKGVEVLWKTGSEPKLDVRDRVLSLSDLCGLLWNCTDIMPGLELGLIGDLCEERSPRAGSYGACARALRAELHRRI